MKKITSVLFLVLAFFAFSPVASVMADTSLAWESLPYMPISRAGATAHVVGDKIILIGSGGNAVSEYDVSTGTWTTRSPIPTARNSHGAAIGPDGRIYVVGGYGAGPSQVLSSLEIYDPVTDIWSTGAQMPTARADLAAVFGSNGKLYAIGGFKFGPNENLGLNIVEEYDPNTDSWATKSSFSYGRYGLGAVSTDSGLVYIAGGSPQRVLEIYDISTDTWDVKAVPTDSHTSGNLLLNNDKFYLVGGLGRRIEEYDSFANTWTTINDSMPTQRYRLASTIASDGKLYTFGGQPDQQHTNVSSEIAAKTVERATFNFGGTPGEIILNATADTYVRSGQSNQNEGAEQFMRVQSSGDNRALVRFDQSALQSAIGGGTVVSATLRLTITDNSNNWGTVGRTVDAHRLISDWAEGNGAGNDRGTGSGATWNCAIDSLIENLAKNCSGSTEWEMGQPNNPAVHPWIETASATQTITNNQTGVVEYDVTADVASFATGSNSNYGWIIKKTNEGQTGQVSFGTKESASVPQLVVIYQP